MSAGRPQARALLVPALLALSLPLLGAGAWWLHGQATSALEEALLEQQPERARARTGLAERAAEQGAALLEAAQRRQSERQGQELASLVPLLIPDADERRDWLAAHARREREDLDSRVRAGRLSLRRALEDPLREVEARDRHALQSAAASAARSVTWAAFLVSAILVALLCLVAALHWRRRVREPASRLAATMEAVAGGANDRLGPESAGALAAPVEAFNRMVDALTAARRELRAEVDRQTAALAEGLDEQQALNRRLTEVLDELREAQALLVRQEKMAALGTLAGGVAHEFNNVLGGIRGCADEVLEELDAPAAVESLGVIRRAAERGRKIVEGLLRFSQASGREPETLDLAAVLRETATLLRHEAEGRGVTLEVHPASSTFVRADPVEIHQVVHNLLLNALQHAPAGSAVEASVRPVDGSVQLRVADRGPGIATTDRERIFEPFFTTRESEGGVGLGLAMSHGIVQALGGELTFADRDGGGTTFLLALPEALENHVRD